MARRARLARQAELGPLGTACHSEQNRFRHAEPAMQNNHVCHTDHIAKGKSPRTKQPPPHEPVAQACGFYPAALFVNTFAKRTVASRVRQLHNTASGLRIREVSRCVRLAVRLVRLQSISPRSETREDNFERLEIVAEKHWNIIL